MRKKKSNTTPVHLNSSLTGESYSSSLPSEGATCQHLSLQVQAFRPVGQKKNLAIEHHSVWHFATEVWKLIQLGRWVLSSYKGWDTFTYFLKLIRAWRISFQTFLLLSSVKTESKTGVFWRASLLRGHELHHPRWHFLSTSCVRHGVKGCVQVGPPNPVNEHDVWTNTTIS